jgi:hypothetical protein
MYLTMIKSLPFLGKNSPQPEKPFSNQGRSRTSTKLGKTMMLALASSCSIVYSKHPRGV